MNWGSRDRHRWLLARWRRRTRNGIAAAGLCTALGLVNSLTSYRLDTLNKWLEARIPVLVDPFVRHETDEPALCGAKCFRSHGSARFATGPLPLSAPCRPPVTLHRRGIGTVERDERLDRLRSRVLIIAAEHDLTPLAEKRALASRLGAAIAVVRGSRHGTPFDAVEATNACIFALLSDQPPPPPINSHATSRSRPISLSLWAASLHNMQWARSFRCNSPAHG